MLGLDALAVAQDLFGSIEPANLLLVGAAYQVGALPVPAEVIERPSHSTEWRFEANISAFRWGRAVAVDPGLMPTKPLQESARGSAEVEVFLLNSARRLASRITGPAILRTWPDGDHRLYNHGHERHTLIAGWFTDQLLPS